MCTLWQRLGRGGRDLSLDAIGLILVEPQYFDKPPKPPPAAKGKKREAENQSAGEISQSKRRRGPGGSVLQDDTVHNDGMATRDAEDHELSDAEKKAAHEQMLAARRGQYIVDARERKRKKDAMKIPPKATRASLPVDEMPLEMMDLVNADLRGFGCRRIPLRLFFSFDRTGEYQLPFPEDKVTPDWDVLCLESDHLECDPSSPTGCLRCAPQPSLFCCDLHHPDRFKDLSTPSQKQSMPGPSRYPAKYQGDPRTMQLQRALEDWRDGEALAVHGDAHFRMMGGSLVLPNAMVKRIVDFAHIGKIRSAEDVIREVTWRHATKYAATVYTIVEAHLGDWPDLPPETQDENGSALREEPPKKTKGKTKKTKKTKPPAAVTSNEPTTGKKCGRCGLRGHISELSSIILRYI